LGPVGARYRLWWAALMLVVWVCLGASLLNRISAPPYLRYPILVLAGIQVARAAYRLIKSIVELARPERVTGTLLDISRAGQSHPDNIDPSVDGLPDLPTHYYFVVDDGSTDVLRPWIVHRGLARGPDRNHVPFDPSNLAAFAEDISRVAFRPGDRIRIEGERWSRYAKLVGRA
jgi:hypothetical protein